MKIKVKDSLAGMHNEALNIACAELEGWRCERVLVSNEYCDQDVWGWSERPNYVSPHAIEALGNVHRLEKLLTHEQMCLYVSKIRDEQVGYYRDWITHDVANVCHATALQRAVALLLVLKPELFEQ